MRGLPWVLAVIFLAATAGGAGQGKHGSGDGGIDVPAERPFDAVNMFGDLGRPARLPDTDENMLWWERMVRGQVGKDRFLILCALKDGDWKRMGDIGDYVEFQTGRDLRVEEAAEDAHAHGRDSQHPVAGPPSRSVKNRRGMAGAEAGRNNKPRFAVADRTERASSSLFPAYGLPRGQPLRAMNNGRNRFPMRHRESAPPARCRTPSEMILLRGCESGGDHAIPSRAREVRGRPNPAGRPATRASQGRHR